MFTDRDPGERVDAVVAVDDGAIVGAGAAFSNTADNLHASYVIAWVAPERRRRGIGSAVLSELIALCRNDRRTDLIMETAYSFERQDDHPYRRFAEKHGFVLANREIRRVLELPSTARSSTAWSSRRPPTTRAIASSPSTGRSPTRSCPACARPATSSASMRRPGSWSSSRR